MPNEKTAPVSEHPETALEWLAQLSAQQAAHGFAIALLFEELAAGDMKAARLAVQRLRQAAAAPMGSGAAAAVEELAGLWEQALDQMPPG